MRMIVGESSKFRMTSISITSSPSSAIKSFSKGLSSSMKARVFLNKTRKIKQIRICKQGLLDFISYIFVIYLLYICDICYSLYHLVLLKKF